MQVVTRRTGLTAELLRVWERRYGVVTPARTRTGRRLYADDEVERLRLLHRATRGGRTIGQVAALSNPALEKIIRQDAEADLAGSDAPAPKIEGDASGAAAVFVLEILRALEGFDIRAMEAALERASFALSAGAFLDDVVAPLLAQVGARWHDGTFRPVHGMVAASAVRRTLERRVSAPPAGAPRLVVATPAGHSHELGALMAAAVASSEGWAVTWLGSGVSAEDIATGARAVRAQAVAVSLVYPAADSATSAELRTLRTLLPKSVHLMVGGAAAPAYVDVVKDIGATSFSDLRTFAEHARHLASGAPRRRSRPGRIRPIDDHREHT